MIIIANCRLLYGYW